MRKIAVIILAICCLCMSGFTSEAASNFDKEVAALLTLPEITDSDIAYLENAYNSLSPSEKAQVKMYNEYKEILSQYEQTNYSELLQDAIISNDVFKMIEAYETIQSLNEKQRTNIKGIQDFEETLVATAYETILSYKNANVEKMYELIMFCQDLFTDEQLEKCLIHYGKWNGYFIAEDYIKSLLKSPRSYHLYSGSADGFKSPLETGGYRGAYEIKYGATNTFGGEVTNTIRVYVTFFIDKENIAIDYVYVGDGEPYGLGGVSETPTPKETPKP